MKETQDVDRIFERFELIVNGPALFSALVTALELGIFRFLSLHPKSGFDDVLRFTGLRADKLRVLLHALCATELVDKADGRYMNSPVAEKLLAPDGQDSWRHILIGWQRIYYPAFVHLTSALREGTNTALSAYPGSEPTLYQRLAHNPELQATFHACMAAFTLQTMSGLLESPELATVRHVLDIGGNDGTTATRLAARYPELRVTIFDLPSVTRAGERAVSAELADRIQFHPGDLFQDPFPRGVDAVLFSHVLEIFDEAQILSLLAKAFDVLPTGGKLLIYGFHASDDERRGAFSARLSLYLHVLASGHGMAYPAKDYERWLRQVGCGRVTSFTGLPYEHGLIVGWKQ
ncbi:methyltransferase [Sorangium sp. So ce1128]|uniref:O-methyltransferase n=1 Tax=Sorangium cellulosum TaxID=56 RepID=A0A3S5GY82_SORCE|nr:O-methyltransferase [Sorangium cellulosum]